MNAIEVSKEYVEFGFTPIPLAPNTKEPPSGTKLATIENIKINNFSNIGVFAGSPNGLVIIDADSPKSIEFVTRKLTDFGLYPWTTIVKTPKRRGQHFWLRILDVPDTAQAYYKLSKEVGDGEFRVHRPAYVVAPWSSISDGEYQFAQGGISFFADQPVVPWEFMTWLVPKDRLIPTGRRVGEYHKWDNSKVLAINKNFRYRRHPHVLQLMESMKNAKDDERIHHINYKTGKKLVDTFESRSEVEFAIIMGLVLSGWTFEEIRDVFEDNLPGHYANVPNPERYLITSYNNVIRILSKGE
jgi:hypothetical protein